GSRNIISRLKRAYIKRAAQVDIVNKHIAKCTYPVIVCGDFNDTPLSYSYKSIIKSKKLKDSYIEAGNGFSQTYAGTAFPSFRIDYILHSSVFKTLNYSRDKIYFSDHYPVRVEILPK
ncbi:MAG: endonuclease/exonuclease/phosphatase family protein, partial [Bacteroidales bacterium]|nr:endonuclease/exonuclease/phosphatase family protein [Bacteroidales bacterium]